MKKIFLVVIYKCKIEESKTCQFLVSQKILSNPNNIVYIWDNSPTPINTIENITSFFCENNILFNHTPENTSLSKIYNYILSEFRDFDGIQLFDQDSYINKNNYDSYLDNLLSEITETDIFLPKIYAGDLLYSPGKLNICWGRHFKKLENGINQCKNYTAIGSGILFRPKFCIDNKIKFSEKLKLYSVDTDFIYKISSISNKFYVMDLDFKHDLSETSLSESEKKIRRKIQLQGLIVVYEKNFFKRIVTQLYIIVLGIMGKI